MTGAVAHEGDEITAEATIRGRLLIQEIGDHLKNSEIGAFVASPNVVGLPEPAARKDQREGAGVVLHMKPVTYIDAVSVDRQWHPLEAVEDHERDEFLRKLIGTIVIRAIRKNDWHAVRPVLGHCEVIRGSLRGRVVV